MKKLIVLLFLALPSVGFSAVAHLIVNLQPGVTIKEILASYQIDYVDHTAGGPFVLFSVDETRKEQVELAMGGDPRIVWVEDDAELGSPEDFDQRPEDIRAGVGGTIPAIFDTSAGAYYNRGYLAQINYRTTKLAPLDRTVRVAVLDSGLSPHQPVLWNHVFATMDATVPTNFAAFGSVHDVAYGVDTNLNGAFDEGVGHGTFVASVIATTAPHARLAIARVADSDGFATAWSIIKGIAFAVSSGCEIANISLGSVDQPAALGDVIDWADLHGLTVIAGAGNDDTDRVLYPSRFSEVICVAGIDEDDKKAEFSNFEGKVRQSAPSVLVAGAWWKGGMVGWSGTSFAAPFVTGCLADVARKRPRWTPDEIRQVMDTTGTNIDAQNPAYAGELGLRLDWSKLYQRATSPLRPGGRRK